jgi:hypothetical protein
VRLSLIVLTEDTVITTALGVLLVWESLAVSTALRFHTELAQILPESALVRGDTNLNSIYHNASVITGLTTQSQMQAVLHAQP